MTAYTLITGIDIYTPHNLIPAGVVAVRDGKIAFVGTKTGARRVVSGPGLTTLDFKGHIAVPGFIDIHVHGGGGADFMDGTPDAAANVLETHLKKGTTSAVPTVMTASEDDIVRAISAVLELRKAGKPLPEVLGLHLEGPFISRDKSGAQPEKYIRPFDVGTLSAFIKAAKGTVRHVTLAPEIPKAGALVRYLKRKAIIAAAGHSNATFGQAIKGLKAGISHGTHLFNAMSGLFHRDPGLAGALLMDDAVSVELIADGIHVHPAVLRLVTRVKPLEKIVLVTDATRRTGLSQVPPRTAEGKLYGSAITLDIALRNMVDWTGLPLTDILPMVTSNPACLMGAGNKKGALRKGADADIVILDRRLRVKAVFLKGKRI
jgi:N-acetylglucosamine-6-phosphate deacetylase